MAPEPQLEEVLERLEREERELSTKRVTIHERLASFPNSVLEEQERQLPLGPRRHFRSRI